MKYPGIIFLFGGMLFLCSCGGSPRAAAVPGAVPARIEPAAAQWEIINHKASVLGEELPEWVARYIAGGLEALEALPQYADKYVFVAENVGANMDALTQWALGFNIDQDLARLVSARVQARLSHGDNPDREYGPFYEQAVKLAADHGYPGAQREADFWLLRRSTAEEGSADAAEGEVYHFYILISIDAELLKSAVNEVLLAAAALEIKPSRGETLAIDRIRAAFYEGF
jgi:hypothetical protein